MACGIRSSCTRGSCAARHLPSCSPSPPCTTHWHGSTHMSILMLRATKLLGLTCTRLDSGHPLHTHMLTNHWSNRACPGKWGLKIWSPHPAWSPGSKCRRSMRSAPAGTSIERSCDNRQARLNSRKSGRKPFLFADCRWCRPVLHSHSSSSQATCAGSPWPIAGSLSLYHPFGRIGPAADSIRRSNLLLMANLHLWWVYRVPDPSRQEATRNRTNHWTSQEYLGML